LLCNPLLISTGWSCFYSSNYPRHPLQQTRKEKKEII
jgi:hypothetical protein